MHNHEIPVTTVSSIYFVVYVVYFVYVFGEHNACQYLVIATSLIAYKRRNKVKFSGSQDTLKQSCMWSCCAKNGHDLTVSVFDVTKL